MFNDLDTEFHVLKLLFEDFFPKIIKGAGNCENMISHVKFLCLKFGGTHCTFYFLFKIIGCKHEIIFIHIKTQMFLAQNI